MTQENSPCIDITKKIDPKIFPHLTKFVSLGNQRDIKAWNPDVYRETEAFCRTDTFWREVNYDVKQAAEHCYRPSYSNFFGYYDASKKEYAPYLTGKYHQLQSAHFLAPTWYLNDIPAEERSSIEKYAFFKVEPPADDPDLANLIWDSRRTVRRSFSYMGPIQNAFIEQRFTDPEFWEELRQDFSAFDGPPVRFDEFIKHYGGHNWNHGIFTSYPTATGKYGDIYRYLEKNKVKGKEARGSHEFQRSWAEPILVSASDELKQDIGVHFFGEPGKVETGKQLLDLGFPEALLPAVKRFGHLRDDIQPDVLIATSTIFARNANIDIHQALRLLTQYAQEKGNLPSDPTVLSVTGETIAFTKYKAGETGDSISERTDPVIENYSKPLLRGALFKEVGSYWYANKGDLTVSQVHDYLYTTWHDCLEKVAPGDKNAATVLEYEIKQIGDRLDSLVALRDTIPYFQSTIQGGEPTFLYLHQLDGIQQLLDKEGAIYADEAGLGKTLTVGLASFLLAERKKTENIVPTSTSWFKKIISSSFFGKSNENDPSSEKPTTPTRVLVVGSKAVTDNWETEIGIHTTGIDVVNLTFSTDDPEFGVIPNLPERKDRFFQKLRSSEAAAQLLLVHYDVFRDPAFIARLGRSQIGAIAIDEAHNVKTGVISILSENKGNVTTVAKRTQGLYQFMEGFNGPVIFATGTPFVKNLREPLLMAHMVDKDQVPLSAISKASQSTSETNKLLTPLMVRHLKKDIPGISQKSVSYVRIPFDSLDEADVRYIQRERARIDEHSSSPGERFFAMLNLEIQAKFPWLVEEVKRLDAEHRKVVIFTPFVHGEGKLTKDSSTVSVAEHLHNSGTEGVAVLDSTLSPLDRLSVQGRFRQPAGQVRTLVASEGIGGEGITLSSFENRATHAIILVPPTSLARFLQVIDRIHRIGQPHDVTIQVPFVEGFPGQEMTYDQRLVNRLQEELTIFEQAIDGRFSINRDLYQEIGGVLSKSRLFTKETMEQRSSRPAVGALFNIRMLGDTHTPRRERAQVENVEGSPGEIPIALKQELAALPAGLSMSQLELAYKYKGTPDSLSKLVEDSEFQATLATLDDSSRKRINEALAKSGDVTEFIFHSNLSLVRHIARKFSNPDDIMDLIQEGNMSLMRVIEGFDVTRRVPFGAYAGTGIYRSIARYVSTQRKNTEVSLESSTEGKDTRTILEKTPDTSPLVDDEVITSQTDTAFQERLNNNLTPRQLEVVNLVLAGYTQSEIAKSLDTSRQNVKIILNTVRNRMHLRPQ